MITVNGSEETCAEIPAVVSMPAHLDTQGRVRLSKEQRRVLLEEFERSGMSMAGFVKRTGLKYPTFANWVARHRGRKRSGRKGPLRLLEAVVASGPASCPLIVQLPGGARVELCQSSQVPLLAALVRALEKPC